MPIQAPFPTLGWQSSPKSFSHCSPSLGFTADQIGQLYCLVNEHVQLLIQSFSICVLDPSRQQVSTEVQNMISEMVEKHEEALACRKVPYPVLCFHPQNLHSSLHFDIHQSTKSSFWTPLVENPVLSVLDVAPLGLAKRYMTDVSATVLRYRRSHMVEDLGDNSHLKREPLFSLPMISSVRATENDIRAMSPSTVQPLLPSQVQPKKSLAATLVESTKMQSVALVPKDIAKLAQRFYPLFNSALFPHKPPVPPVANRVLFTDSEDGLLAMGLMEYNNDWMAIQRRFLPCKSQHQIFVRQKNRSSSKAHENPIKAVRRMKSSPLTADEMACIKEGVKLFKHDWLSIWKFFVPHRDPSLLPRQWRIATGTQKSYKKSEAYRRKRRLYEAKRKQYKASMIDCQTSSEKVGNGENTADGMDDEDEAYIHEAFLADTEPRGSACFTASSGKLSLNSISKHATSHVGSWPYHMRKAKGVRVVKLAPDLPPVNLPSSVRVISQSAFKSYYSGPSYPKAGDNAGINHLHWLPQVSKEGTVTAKPGNHVNCFAANGPQINNRRDESSIADRSVAEENTSESDLHMHPLLFEVSEQFSSYYPMNCTASGTYNFFPEVPLQAESDLLKSQNLVRTHISTTPYLKEAPLNLGTIDFHPLLQRNVHVCQSPEDSHDESVPEIVMEQEELSDSDEEIQHVEFECEEMDDSEGE